MLHYIHGKIVPNLNGFVPVANPISKSKNELGLQNMYIQESHIG